MDLRDVRLGLGFATLAMIATRLASAQGGNTNTPSGKDSWIIEVAFAAGPGTIPQPFFGSKPDLEPDLVIMTLRSVKRFRRLGRLEFSYAPDVVQLSLLAGTPSYRGSWFRSPDGLDSTYLVLRDGRRAVGGVGAAPLGVRMNMRLTSSVAVCGEAAGGVSWFAREVPDRGAGHVQFQFIAGGGVRLSLGRRHAVLLGFVITIYRMVV